MWTLLWVIFLKACNTCKLTWLQQFGISQFHQGKNRRERHRNLADLEVQRVYAQYFPFFLFLSWQIAQCDQVQVNFSVLLPNLFLVLLLLMTFLGLCLCTEQIILWKLFYMDKHVPSISSKEVPYRGWKRRQWRYCSCTISNRCSVKRSLLVHVPKELFFTETVILSGSCLIFLIKKCMLIPI